ncbi:MAG: leucyl/phenylalanyl-tRNA--protein transferase [Gilvibacter sp.]
MSNNSTSIVYLEHNDPFPPVSNARQDGLIAVGGDLSVARLKMAYEAGIFPWFAKDDPILWWSPDPRMILVPNEFNASKSLRKVIKSEVFKITFNTAFEQVISKCAMVKRNQQEGTWITSDMLSSYCKLHEQGLAKSVEIWQGDKLVGGLYGVDLPEKKVFCGESMFSEVSNASKVALYALCEHVAAQDYLLVDCQIYNDHLASLGAKEIPRSEFLALLE